MMPQHGDARATMDVPATVWADVDRVLEPQDGGWLVRFAPIGAPATVVALVLLGRLWTALVVGTAVFGILQARLLWPSFAAGLEATLAGLARSVSKAVGTALSWVCLSLVFAMVFVPVSALGLLFRQRPSGHAKGLSREGWVPRRTAGELGSQRSTAGSALRRSYAPPNTTTPVAIRTPRALKALTCAVALLVIDLGLGALLTGTHVLAGERGDARRTIEADVAAMMQAPPIAGEPWAHRYRQDLSAFQLEPSPFRPYIISGFGEFHSPYINTTARGRASYRPAHPSGVEPLRVAFFGGSTMFGVGQRDAHTIPSEVARIAEARGVVLDVENYGHAGWVSWQEQQFAERRLARGGPLDLIVFYDGPDEFRAQQMQFSPNPTYEGARAFDQVGRDYQSVHNRRPGYQADARDVVSAYAEASGIVRLVRHVAGGSEASASIDTAGSAPTSRETDAALDIYRRSAAVIDDLAHDHRTPVRLFWQPTRSGWDQSIVERLPSDVTDLSHVFSGEGDNVYIDDVNTSEAGARLVAEAMWEHFGAQLEQMAAEPNR